MLFISLALATSGFDATTAAASFTGVETYTSDEAVRLWSKIERLEDPDRTLMAQEHFSDAVAWPQDNYYMPWIKDCFGTNSPGSWASLLHIGPSMAASHGTPILFIPGAGDNGSRGFITMATHMDLLFRPVFAVTFAHPHGDAYKQAEAIANAIARIKHLTGAAQVDVVSHSKGGIATAIYLSNVSGTSWPDSDYEDVGTRYRGDVRKAIFIATPLSGIDTAYRWPNGNYVSLDADTAISPSSWATYGFSDLSDQDFLPDGKDYFPGHRQLLSRQSPRLPGDSPWLGPYALQQDWYTTYEGGIGFVSTSDGINDAIQAGGNMIDHLKQTGVDPSVSLYILAGTNPLMPNGTESYLLTYWDRQWVDLATSSTDAWGEFLSLIVGNTFASLGYSEGDLQGLAAGKLILGEISAESDGLVFVESATDGSALTARGAAVVETRKANLSHLDLLYASPITGDLLIQEAQADPLENGWMQGVGERYIVEDTIGQVELWLEDPPDTGGDDTGDDSGSGTDDSGTQTDDSDVNADDSTPGGQDSDAGGNIDEGKSGRDNCGCEGAGGGALGGLGVLAGVLLLRRRRD